MESFATERMLDGTEPNEAHIAELMSRSLMLVTALAPEIGYDNAANIAKYVHKHGKTLKEAGLELGLVDEETSDRVVGSRDDDRALGQPAALPCLHSGVRRQQRPNVQR